MKGKETKKFLALLLSLIMVIGMFPLAVSAEGLEEETQTEEPVEIIQENETEESDEADDAEDEDTEETVETIQESKTEEAEEADDDDEDAKETFEVFKDIIASIFESASAAMQPFSTDIIYVDNLADLQAELRRLNPLNGGSGGTVVLTESVTLTNMDLISVASDVELIISEGVTVDTRGRVGGLTLSSARSKIINNGEIITRADSGVAVSSNAIFENHGVVGNYITLARNARLINTGEINISGGFNNGYISNDSPGIININGSFRNGFDNGAPVTWDMGFTSHCEMEIPRHENLYAWHGGNEPLVIGVPFIYSYTVKFVIGEKGTVADEAILEYEILSGDPVPTAPQVTANPGYKFLCFMGYNDADLVFGDKTFEALYDPVEVYDITILQATIDVVSAHGGGTVILKVSGRMPPVNSQSASAGALHVQDGVLLIVDDDVELTAGSLYVHSNAKVIITESAEMTAGLMLEGPPRQQIGGVYVNAGGTLLNYGNMYSVLFHIYEFGTVENDGQITIENYGSPPSSTAWPPTRGILKNTGDIIINSGVNQGTMINNYPGTITITCANASFANYGKISSQCVLGDDILPNGSIPWREHPLYTGPLYIGADYSNLFYTVEFDIGNYGTVEDDEILLFPNRKIGVDLTPNAPDVEANEGWTFIGFFNGDGNEYEAGVNVTGTGPLTLTYVAQYEPDYTNDEVWAKVEFVTDDRGRLSGDTEFYFLIGDSLNLASLEAPTVTAALGWEFDGWDNELNDMVSVKLTTITAKYDAIRYNITYNLGGGTNHESNPSKYTIEDGEIILGDPSREGYEFLGWVNEDRVPVIGIDVDSTGDREFTATWSLIPTEPTDPEPTEPTDPPTPPTTPPTTPPATPAGTTDDGDADDEDEVDEADEAVVEPATEQEVVDVDEPETPLTDGEADGDNTGDNDSVQIVYFDDPDTPLASPESWAISNLLLVFLTALTSIMLFVMWLSKRRNESGLLNWVSLIPTAAAVLLFALTEDMSNIMVFANGWTVWMTVIAVAQGAIAVAAIAKGKAASGFKA